LFGDGFDPMVTVYLVFLTLLAIERLVELRISRRHENWAKKQGGLEFGQRHFRLMKMLHTVFLFSCAGEVLFLNRPFLPVLAVPMLVVALSSQVIRYWCISTLGPYWNVRVIVVPGAQPVTEGPYRFMRHPNYLAVILEGLAVPLVHTAWVTAAAFTVLNAFLLWARIQCEENALAAHCSYREQLGDVPRLFPGMRGFERR
jgi:methyltransferase